MYGSADQYYDCVIPVNGVCGSANGTTTTSYPTSNWCTTGTKVDVDITAGDGSYNWRCDGSGGGSNMSCSANKTTASLCITPPSSITACSSTPDITLPNGQVWKACNEGATNICDAGNYYQWGRNVGFNSRLPASIP